MKKIKLSAIAYLSILFCWSFHLSAQMTSMMTTSAIREIPAVSSIMDSAIKSVSIGDNHVLTLVDWSSYSYAFLLTSEGSSTVDVLIINGVDIKDFDFDTVRQLIYYCGNTGVSSPVGVVGQVSINAFSSSIPERRIFFSEVKNIKKIDICIPDMPLVSVIGELASGNLNSARYYINVNMLTGAYQLFESPFPLLDVKHTANRICVLGKVSNNQFLLFTHDRMNPTVGVIGRIYQTSALANYWTDIDKWYVSTSLSTNADSIAIAYASSYYPIEIVNINTTSMNINSTIGINHTKLGRGAIIDIKYNTVLNNLVCLYFNGYDQQDIIAELNTTLTNATLINPLSTIQGINVFKTLAMHKNSYIATRNQTNSQIIWFDKFLNNVYAQSCFTYYNTNIDNINTVTIYSAVNYNSMTSGVKSINTPYTGYQQPLNYQINCIQY